MYEYLAEMFIIFEEMAFLWYYKYHDRLKKYGFCCLCWAIFVYLK